MNRNIHERPPVSAPVANTIIGSGVGAERFGTPGACVMLVRVARRIRRFGHDDILRSGSP